MKEALKLALEALETELAVDMTNGAEVGEAAELMCEAITAIKQALAAPVQEPVAVKHMLGWVESLKRQSDYGQHMRIPGLNAGACFELAIELEQFINTTLPAAPVQEPNYKVTVVDDQHPKGVPLEQWGRPAPVQEPVGALILGGVIDTSDGPEYEEWDVEWNTKAVEALQEKLVTSNGVTLMLYTTPHAAQRQCEDEK